MRMTIDVKIGERAIVLINGKPSRWLGPGDGMSMPPDTPYGYTAGPEGVTLLEVRDKEHFVTEFVEGDTVVATDLQNT